MKRSGPVLLTLWIVLLGGNFALYLTVLPIRVLHHAIMSAALALWFWHRPIPRTPLLAPLGAGIAWILVCALFAVDPRMAFENAWFWAVNAGLFLVFVDWCLQGRADAMLSAHLAAGAALAVVGLVEFAITRERPGSLFFLIDSTGAYAAPVFVLAVGIALRSYRLSRCIIRFGTDAIGLYRRLIRRFRLVGALALLLGVLLLVNNTRGALISAGVGLAVQAVLEYKPSRRLQLVGAAVAVVGALIVGYTSIQPGRASGDQHRLALWHGAVQMAADRPFTGVGPGLFGLAFNTLYSTRAEQYAIAAHSWPLNTAAELGAPGLLLGLALLIVFIRQLPRERTPTQNAALAALAGLAAHSLVDNLIDPNIAALALLLAAMLTTPAARQAGAPRRWRIVAPAAILVCGLLLTADAAQVYYERSLTTKNVWDAQKAANIDPALDLYDLQIERLAWPILAPGLSRDFAIVGYARDWR